MHLLRKAQIAYLKVVKVPTKVSSKYTDFTNVFLSKFAIKLPKHMRINNYTIKLIDDPQSLYGPIYSLSLVKLETLKTYIENNLINNFIGSFKSLFRAFIFFDKKQNGSQR